MSWHGFRDEYVKATKDVKASLEKLLAIYEDNVKAAQEKLATAKKLFSEGLLSKAEVDENQRLLNVDRAEGRRDEESNG
jgi:outer membrane protein TolC